ncbi:MAG: hypothetical protein WD065_00645, partial [Planctomycetaceae bacterium]
MDRPRISLTAVTSIIALTATALWGYERFGREGDHAPRPHAERMRGDAVEGNHFASVNDEFASDDP